MMRHMSMVLHVPVVHMMRHMSMVLHVPVVHVLIILCVFIVFHFDTQVFKKLGFWFVTRDDFTGIGVHKCRKSICPRRSLGVCFLEHAPFLDIVVELSFCLFAETASVH